MFISFTIGYKQSKQLQFSFNCMNYIKQKYGRSLVLYNLNLILRVAGLSWISLYFVVSHKWSCFCFHCVEFISYMNRYEPYLWENEKQSYQRYAVLYGFLVQLNRMYMDTVQKLPSNTESNVLRCSIVPRFRYLPIRLDIYQHFFEVICIVFV